MRSVYATGEARPVATASPFAGMPRELIEEIIAAAIDELDTREGDPDLEDDEPQTSSTRSRLAVLWPGTPEDEEESHYREHDPAEHEHWEQPVWEKGAEHARATNLFTGRTPPVERSRTGGAIRRSCVMQADSDGLGGALRQIPEHSVRIP